MALDETSLLEEIVQAKEVSTSNIHLLGVMNIEYIYRRTYEKFLQHLRNQYDELIPFLSNNHPDVFPPEFYTWEQFLWACELWYSNSMKVLFNDGKLKTCLVPVAGFLNHSVC